MMQNTVIFGNSGSGKSTLAKHYARKYRLKHLDLDDLAWLETSPPTRKSVQDSIAQIDTFLRQNPNWVVEGCYVDLLAYVAKNARKLIFLNPGIEACVKNAKKRPWEPHKYESAESQNKNLDMLIDWIRQYPVRTDEFSLTAHTKLFQQFRGEKEERNSNRPLD